MASENTKKLYKHYLTVPNKARHAAILLKKFPELEEKEILELDKENEEWQKKDVEEVKKEVKKSGKKSKR